MPIYEYECQKCGVFEKIQKFSDPELTECEECGGGVRKLISAAAFHLKGGGWYVTDFRDKGKKKSGGDSKDDTSSSSSSSESASSSDSADSSSKSSDSTSKSSESSSGSSSSSSSSASAD